MLGNSIWEDRRYSMEFLSKLNKDSFLSCHGFVVFSFLCLILWIGNLLQSYGIPVKQGFPALASFDTEIVLIWRECEILSNEDASVGGWSGNGVCAFILTWL